MTLFCRTRTEIEAFVLKVPIGILSFAPYSNIYSKDEGTVTNRLVSAKCLLQYSQFDNKNRGGEHEPDGPYVNISLFQLGNWTGSNPGRYRRVDLKQICVGRNVFFECAENDRGFYVEWKGDVVRIEYSNG